MDIEEELLAEHSKRQSSRIVTFVLSQPGQFETLVDLSLGVHGKLANRAAWSMGHCLDESPELVDPYLTRLIKKLESGEVSESVKRNIVRVLQFVELPEDLTGRIYDYCFRVVADPEDAIAARAYAMSCLVRICEDYPELAEEVSLLINEHILYGSAGFKARARKELKRLEKLAGQK